MVARRFCGLEEPHEMHTWGHPHSMDGEESNTELYECYGLENEGWQETIE